MAYDDVITALAPTHRWKLNDDYLDSGGGSTRNGSASGSPVFTSGGGIIRTEPLWEALDADGADDFVGIGDSPEINTGTGYTFVRRSWSIWIEHDVNQGTVGDGQVIWEQGGVTNAFSIYATEVAEGQTTSAASAYTAVYKIQLGEGAAAGDVASGTQATVSQFITRQLASDSFPPAATYAVSVSESGIAVDNHQVNQSLLGQLIEQALAGQTTTGVTVVIDFVRLIQVSGATAKTIAIASATSRADLVRGARSRINQLEGTIA